MKRLPLRFDPDDLRDRAGEAVAGHAERVRRLAQSGGNPAYAEAAAIVARMAKLQAPAEHAAFLADLRTRFARRRTFIKLLDQAATAR
jgi:hypothetical protein